MSYLHSIHISREDKEKVAKRLTIEVSQPALAEAYEQIDHLSTLPKDWDEFRTFPRDEKLKTIKQLLQSGASIRQMEKLTGIGRGIIQNL